MDAEDQFALRVQDVHRGFGRRRVLQGIDLELRPGTLTGIVGENGAGKTTLLRILSGELSPQRGMVQYWGRVGYCPQQVVLNDAFTVEQHLRFFQVAYGMTNLDRARELLHVLDFEAFRFERVGVLSGGTRQKLNLTLTLMHDPHVLLLDEPYQGFDWETYLRFWQVADDLRARGRSVLIVSHLAYDTERLDELHRLHAGTLTRGMAINAAHLT